MTFELIPSTEPLEVRGRQTSPVLDFFIPVEAEQTFLRIVALWRDNRPLRSGTPTTFQISGGGVFTTISPGEGSIEIPGVEDCSIAAIAQCQRFTSTDSYLISLTGIAEEADSWSLRIDNNDSETLRYVCVSSRREQDTLQPWMALEPWPAVDDDATPSLLSEAPEVQITVRNRGTSSLLINDEPGAKFGGELSPALLMSRPSEIPPHGVGTITIRCGAVSFRRTLSHTLDTNDTIASHKTFNFEVVPVSGGGGFTPPDPESFCRICGSRCPEYVQAPPPALPGGPCQRSGCRHPAGVHFEVPPDHRNK